MDFPKPRLLVSACLWFQACRYNGQSLQFYLIDKLKDYVEFVTTCPEVEIWLWIPRMPIHLEVKNKKVELIQPSTGKIVTKDMKELAEKKFKSLWDIDGAVLKAKSPSCGPNNVRLMHSNPGSETLKWNGLFAYLLKEKYTHLPVEDEGRLLNYKIREDFLIRIFTLAAFREIKSACKMSDLVEFHANHKYLYLMFHQKDLKSLWNIVANHEKKDVKNVFMDYQDWLLDMLSHTPNKRKATNAITHIFGYFKNDLTKSEKEFFLESLELFKDERIPFSSMIMMLKSWAIKYDNQYILKQKILNPFPSDLLELKDSGRKIEI